MPEPTNSATPAGPHRGTAATPDLHWRAAHLLIAPHRLAFFLAMVVLAASSLWWMWVQGTRFAQVPASAAGLPPVLVHAALMVFGFFPLFFSGFLFTAGPKWLQIEPLPVRAIRVPLLLLALGWLTWLAGHHSSQGLALIGAWGALCAMAWITVLFWRLLVRSEALDRVHARVLALAFAIGTACIGSLVLALIAGESGVALRWVLSGLWGFVVMVFVTVAHRMIPFFDVAAPSGQRQDNVAGTLGLWAGAALFESVAVWISTAAWDQAWATEWLVFQGLAEWTVAAVLLWRAAAWARRQSLRNRLMRMFFLGFVWLGVAYALLGTARWLSVLGAPQLEIGALHALTMGCLGSLMLAMVTRVSCGHSGRSRVVDATLWALFCALQMATALRVLAAVAGSVAPLLLLLAAALWAGIAVVWALRLGSWYGRRRADERPG